MAAYSIYLTREEATAALPNTPNDGDAARARAAASRQERYNSQELCDTDGFMSQFCSGLNARKADAEGELLDHGGMAVFRVLIDATTNELVSTQLHELFNHFAGFGFMNKWRVVRNGAVEWVTDYKLEKNFAAKNLKVAWLVGPACAVLSGRPEFSQREEGRGTGNLSNIYVAVRLQRKNAGIGV